MQHDDRSTLQAEALPVAPIRTGYLLIDPCNLDEDNFPEPLPMIHCTPASLTNSDAVMPRLIDVAALTPAQQDSLPALMLEELRGERTPFVCAWLECEADAAALARHITRFLVGPDGEDASNDVFWRYYDPRVFALAVSLFRTAQTQALLGPVLTWRFPWCGHWWRVEGPGVEIAPIKGTAPAWPGDTQWASLAHCAALSAVLGQLQDEQGVISPQASLQRLRQVDAAMVRAKVRLRLTDKDDLISYALLNVRYGDEFLYYPKLTPAWHELAQGRIRWCDLTALITENDYEAMRANVRVSKQSMGVM